MFTCLFVVVPYLQVSRDFFFLCFACTHPHAYQDVCVCACCLFLLSCPIWDSLFFFWSPDGGFPSACSSSDSSSLCPSLLLDVLWFGLSVGFTPVQMTSLTQKQYIDSFFFFFLSGISDNSHFCTRGCLFFSPERCHVLIDRWIKNKKSNYLFIYLFSQKQNTGTPQCYRSPATKTGTAPSGKIKARKIAAAGKCVT